MYFLIYQGWFKNRRSKAKAAKASNCSDNTMAKDQKTEETNGDAAPLISAVSDRESAKLLETGQHLRIEQAPCGGCSLNQQF